MVSQRLSLRFTFTDVIYSSGKCLTANDKSCIVQQMIRVANATLNHSISSKILESLLALQYRDDTALIANAHPETLVTLKLVLRLFSKVSGLEINYDKSSFVDFNSQHDEQNLAKIILQCQRTVLPVTYLGMPLTIKKPKKQDFEGKLQGWKSK